MNTNNITKVRVNKTLTRAIKTRIGIRQGDSLSPLLFNLIMDKIIEAVKKCGIGYRLRNRVGILCYANDAILLVESEDDL